MPQYFCPQQCLAVCTAAVFDKVIPKEYHDVACPPSCMHACLEASKATHDSGLTIGSFVHENFEMISIVMSVVLAFFGHWIARRKELESERRRLRLERLDAQLRDYFGPIAANLLSSKLAFNTLMRTWSRRGEGFNAQRYFANLRQAERLVAQDEGSHKTQLDPEIVWVRDSWISFHTQLVGPIHKQTMDILQGKSHLFDGLSVRRAGDSPTNRGGAAAATWIFQGRRIAAAPRPRRGYSAETSRGDAAAAT